MPIYSYQCSECGYEKDVLQKLSDKHLVICPECGAKGFARKLTAAGFVLKGSGWYATDFRDGHKKESKDKKPEKNNDKKNEKNIAADKSTKSEKEPSSQISSNESQSSKKKSSIKNQSKPV
jgi:putative FmdB family regulatory protein